MSRRKQARPSRANLEDELRVQGTRTTLLNLAASLANSNSDNPQIPVPSVVSAITPTAALPTPGNHVNSPDHKTISEGPKSENSTVECEFKKSAGSVSIENQPKTSLPEIASDELLTNRRESFVNESSINIDESLQLMIKDICSSLDTKTAINNLINRYGGLEKVVSTPKQPKLVTYSSFNQLPPEISIRDSNTNQNSHRPEVIKNNLVGSNDANQEISKNFQEPERSKSIEIIPTKHLNNDQEFQQPGSSKASNSQNLLHLSPSDQEMLYDDVEQEVFTDNDLDSTDEIVKHMETSSVFGQIKSEVLSKNSEKSSDSSVHCKIEPKVESKDDIVKGADELSPSLNNNTFQSSCDYEPIKTKILANIHKGVVDRPKEDEMDEDPPGLKTKLMVHQKHGLAWMRWRESQKPKGGLLADDMGLGKTLQIIALILATKNSELTPEISEDSSDDKHDSASEFQDHAKQNKSRSCFARKRYFGKTLVVCPTSILEQWRNEIKHHCIKGALKTTVYHGANRNSDEKYLCKFDVVITSYGIVNRERKAMGATYKIDWERVILDEAHIIRNPKSQNSEAACFLNSKYRWVVTGTPIQNRESDLYPLFKFLKFAPFDDYRTWRSKIERKSGRINNRLLTAVKAIMLRRTKQELIQKNVIGQRLPNKSLNLIEVTLDPEEQLAYQKILMFSQTMFAQFIHQKRQKALERNSFYVEPKAVSYREIIKNFTKEQLEILKKHRKVGNYEILLIIMRLRQMCCHPALNHAMLDQADIENNDLDDSDTEQLDHGDIERSLSKIDDELRVSFNQFKPDKMKQNILTKDNPVFDDDRQSSKVKLVLEKVKEVLELKDKMIIVSQWTSFLNVIARNLNDMPGVIYEIFSGKTAVKERQVIVDEFNDRRSDLNVLLLSLTAGGVGLNLVGANHIFLIDLHWNPQLEEQAQDRIYRFGQRKDIQIYKFICKDTIEEKIKQIQQVKLQIAETVITGTKNISSRLTLEDIKLLFS